MSITQVYTRFFSLQLVHDYFELGRCTALAMRPTRTCQERLARAGCLFRSSPDGGYVAWSGHNGGSAAFDLNPVEPFMFLLTCSDPQFLTYTDLDWGTHTPRDACLHFAFAGSAAGPGRGLLLPVSGARFAWQSDDARTGKVLHLVRVHDDLAVWSAPAPDRPFKSLNLWFGDVVEGRYRLELDGTVLVDFVLTDTSAPQGLGIVEVFADPPQTGRPPPTYAAHFPVRHSLWRYIVQSPNKDSNLAAARIVSTRGPSFAAPIAVTSRGRPAVAFEADEAVALKDRPGSHYHLELALGPEPGVAPRSLALGLAGPAATRTEDRDGKRMVWTTMYVYL